MARRSSALVPTCAGAIANAKPAGIAVSAGTAGRTSPSGRNRIPKQRRPPAHVWRTVASNAVTEPKGAGGFQVEARSNREFAGRYCAPPSETDCAAEMGGSTAYPPPVNELRNV